MKLDIVAKKEIIGVKGYLDSEVYVALINKEDLYFLSSEDKWMNRDNYVASYIACFENDEYAIVDLVGSDEELLRAQMVSIADTVQLILEGWAYHLFALDVFQACKEFVEINFLTVIKPKNYLKEVKHEY